MMKATCSLDAGLPDLSDKVAAVKTSAKTSLRQNVNYASKMFGKAKAEN